MESNNIGAEDEVSRRARREAEKRALIDRIREESINKEPITREELYRQFEAIRERNRLRREEEQRKRDQQQDDDTGLDKPALKS